MSSAVQPEAGDPNLGRIAAMEARIAAAAAIALSHVPPVMLHAVVARTVRSGRRPSADLVLEFRRRVVTVSRLCAGDGCVPRSVAIALLARRHGYGVTWCTGVRDRPFAAHAWVEIDGAPVGEISYLEDFQTTMVATPMYASPGIAKDAP